MAKRRSRHHKKSSKTFWIVLGAIVVLLGVWVFASGGPANVDIDFSQYSYTDAEVENPDAAHTLVEFGDFQCPACGARAPVIKSVKQSLDVNVEYKHFPLRSIHPYAQLAAEASECARDQGRFWAYHDVLFDNQNLLAENYLLAYAEGLGLDMEQFSTCLDQRLKQTVVEADYQEGVERGVDSTPTLFLDGQRVDYYTYAQFEQAIR